MFLKRKKTVIFASALVGFFSLALSPTVKAEVTITPRNNGDVVVSPGNGGCTVLFNSRGEIITNGSSCSDRDINKARQAMDSYRREQNADDHNGRGGYADSEAGGPDFWEVTGVANNDFGLKAKPSLDSAFTVRGLRNGTLLRNLGCKNHNGDRWCRVEVRNNPSQKGWARTQYLRESGGSSSSNRSGDYADSDAGGPDFWEATNFNADFLGLRRKPDQDAVIDFRVKKGTILRNLGCKKHDDVRWCQVQVKDKPDQKGWVKGEYLRESSGSH
jgi:uncharacterized protein YraI